MAELRFDFVASGLSQLSQGLGNLQNQINGINRNSNVNINTGGTTRNVNLASDSILGLRARLNELLRTYGSLTEAQRNSASVTNNLVPEINRLREAVTQANREYDNLRRGTGRDIPSDSITGMRQRLNDLRRTYDGLSESQRNSGRVQNNLVTEINRLNQAVSQAEQSTGRFQRNVGNYQQRMIGANGVTMEFNRVIQDAPFGMMGIGNNLQQLASNWGDYTRQAREAATANGTTVTTMGLVRGAIGGILSPINLLTLGISVATSAWTFYSMNTKTAKEETKDMNNQFTTQLGKLTNVISLTQKSALTERDKAIAVGLYNKELGDTLGKVKTYSELEKTLIKNGSNYVKYLSLKSQAEATYQISLKQTAQMMTNIMSLESKGRSTGFSGWVSKASDAIDELVYGEGSQGKTKITSAEAMRIAQLPTDKDFYIAIRGMGDALKKGLKDVRKDWKKSIQSSNLGVDLTQEFNKIADGLNLKMPDLNLDKISNSLKGVTDKLKEAIDYLKELRSLSGVSEKDFAMVGKVGIDAQISSLAFDFNDKIKQIEDFQQKVLNDTTLTESKRAQIIAETNKTIQYLMGEASANMKDVIAKNIEALDKMQVKAVKTIKDVEIVESPKQKQGRNREDDRDWKEYANILNQSVNYIFTNLKSNIDEFGLKARSVFYTLGETVGDMLKQLANKNTAKFMESITKDAKSFSDLKDNWKNMSSQDKWSAGLGMAGSAVSSLTPQTSSGGQAIGGALSGAAAGMAFGPWGAAVGAVVGGVSGLLKAAKNKRQEKILLQQMEEQKKANRLLERMNALSYASQIIGQKTEYGIVSGVRRNEFGQIVSVVQGQDIIMVADRTNKQKGR